LRALAACLAAGGHRLAYVHAVMTQAVRKAGTELPRLRGAMRNALRECSVPQMRPGHSGRSGGQGPNCPACAGPCGMRFANVPCRKCGQGSPGGPAGRDRPPGGPANEM
jgi:hypothetical protein